MKAENLRWHEHTQPLNLYSLACATGNTAEAAFCDEYDPFDFSGFEGTPMPGTHVQRGKLWLVGKVDMMGHPTLCHFLFTIGS